MQIGTRFYRNTGADQQPVPNGPQCPLDRCGEMGLMLGQSEWKLLRQNAETELQTCRLASQQMQRRFQSLQRKATLSLERAPKSSTEASKQLRESPPSGGHARTAAGLGECPGISPRFRLGYRDASVAESCQVGSPPATRACTHQLNLNVVGASMSSPAPL